MGQDQAGMGPRPWRRRLALGTVVATVLLAHALLTRGMISQMEGLAGDAPTIQRMEAVMVADMRLSAPPVVVAAPMPPSPAPVVAAAAPEAASAASTPASKPAPEPPASQASAPEPAASEPVVAALTPASAPQSAASSASEPGDTPPTAVAKASAPTDAEAFEWPLATRVTFKAEGYIRGPIYGQAQVEWVRQGTRYQVHVDASVGPSFAPLGSQRWTSEGDITPAGLEPKRFESINKLLISSGTPRRVIFHPGEVELADGKREPKLPMVQDPASHYIQLAYQALLDPTLMRVGGTLSMPLAWTRKQDTVVYDIEAREELDTPLGKIDTFRLKPRPLASSQKDNEKEKQRDEILAEIWIAPSLQYLPIRMLLRQGKANYLDMKMDKMPQQTAAPPAQDVPPAQK
ncbi:MAG TPA: DUF3108 domain-containing protein [Candidatus Aquabacterium excrementipullorum]|nr:DUF3108 domain-containing protein [Candidatus Aquabacterium excrementipullorum]